MFVGSLFCPHCGAKAEAADKLDGPELPCPGCASRMSSVRVGQVAMYQCEGCGSAWLSRDVFEALCADRQQQGALAASLGNGPSTAQVDLQRPAHYVKCPVCAKIMNRVNFGHTSGVVVDVCKPHGIWFERDELRRVLAFTAHGGLEQHAGTGESAEVARLRALNLYGGATTLHPDAEAALLFKSAAADPGAGRSPLATLLNSLFT